MNGEDRPNINEYTDYRAYLKALYDFEKARGDFSYSVFAERAGLKSRGFLRTVISGKRKLSPGAIPKFIVGFAMNFAEGELFKALVNFNQAGNFESRKYYWETYLKLRPNKSKHSQRVSDEYLYLARIAYPIMLVILGQPHVKKDLVSLSKMLGLKPSEVEEGIRTLEKLDVIRELNSSHYVTTADNFRTSNDTPSIARQTFHNNMLDMAKGALELDHTLREFQTMMVALNREEFLYIRQRVRSLIDEVAEKFSGQRPDSEKVYSVNINVIPVTPDFIRVEKSKASQKSGDKENSVEENP